MRIHLCGVRGSTPAPGVEFVRYGGQTSCVALAHDAAVAWWQADDFWQNAPFAAVAYIRAAASRAGVPVRQARQDLAQRPGHPAP